jgi:hypothetical protein
MKHILTNAPVLNITDLEKDFLVCIDSFKEGLDLKYFLRSLIQTNEDEIPLHFLRGGTPIF